MVSCRMLTSDNGMGMDEQAAELGRSSGGSDAPQGLQWGAGPGPAPVSPTKKKSLSGAKAAKEAQVGIAAGFPWGTCNTDPGQPKKECHLGSMMQCCQSACLSCLMRAFTTIWRQQQMPEWAEAHNAYSNHPMQASRALCLPQALFVHAA